MVSGPLGATSERFLTFGGGAQLYALRTEDVQEVIRLPPVRRGAGKCPEALLGLANLRGAILPVIALYRLLREARRRRGRGPSDRA